MMVDISKEAVERLIADIPGTKPVKEIFAMQDSIAATLRAQAARIEELEDELYSISIMDAGASL